MLSKVQAIMKYRAFISYRHLSGGRQAVALETALKRYAKPTLSRPMKIFRDEKHLTPGGDLKKSIDEGLKDSEYLIFLAEKAAADSPWCQKELEDWCSSNALNRADRLIIVLIDDHIAFDGINHVHWEQTTALPKLLQPYLTSIPLYMDLRWAKSATDTDLQHPKYRHEINALAARLRGVNPEDLNDEDIRVFRRNIRLRNGAIAVLLAMLLVSVGATFWALDAQKRAEANAVEAKKQQEIAEANAAEARKNLADRIEQETQKERLNFDRYISNGDVFTNSGDFKLALRQYQKADSILLKFPGDPQLLAKKEALTQKLNLALAKTQTKI